MSTFVDVLVGVGSWLFLSAVGGLCLVAWSRRGSRTTPPRLTLLVGRSTEDRPKKATPASTKSLTAS